MKNFEERLARLEELTTAMRSPQTPLDTALAHFEEGLQLAQSLEKDLDKMEKRVEVLLNPTVATEAPTFELFSELPKGL